ncbi:phospholipase D-like domain-containing protein [Pseudomonas savastanoi]|uniref:PLD phosphodiesterase domain-containing protein n=1 Tax=Pseudomonas savastanoi TaxID=29438 RepID=A0AAW3LXH5_PSESS|nr:hypothetical protein [Pseudomonas savastanoi]KTC58336.1 hypothetical protein AO287_20250 [Pseudomonas savastanoi]
MSEGVSILEVIKRGGYEASLITTYNATLPFYEEVLLRKLVSAGCRHNVVLMDRQQCAVAWASQATRPRSAGYAYTLLPIGVNGALHPKVCLLLGAKKASILIGSHNLTLSGLGINREITNWIEVGGVKDGEGAAILRALWQMLREWISLEHGKVPTPIMESALAISRFVTPLTAKSLVVQSTLLGQGAGSRSLIDQVAEHLTAPVRRIAVLGAFFDSKLLLIQELNRRWPEAEIVVGIDLETAQHPGVCDVQGVRHVDVSKLWGPQMRYLHAKVFYFECDHSAGDVFVSGSANPSRPAWMGGEGVGNVEAVLLRRGDQARETAESTLTSRLFDLPELDEEAFIQVRQRNLLQETICQEEGLPILSGISGPQGQICIAARGTDHNVTAAVLLDTNGEVLDRVYVVDCSDQEIAFRTTVKSTYIRSCLLEEDGCPIARAMILHPSVIETGAHSSRRERIRSALSELGSRDANIAKLIATVDRVIFAEQTDREIEEAVREHRARLDSTAGVLPPDCLAISISDMNNRKQKPKILKSGDLAFLIDVLLRRLNEGLEAQGNGVDHSGRTEEEQVGQEDELSENDDELLAVEPELSDTEIAYIVSKKARSLCRKMIAQLELASRDESRQLVAPIQLIAVLALIRELRHLDQLKRWAATGLSLVEEDDRRELLDGSLKYLLGLETRLLEAIDEAAGDSAEETMQLRALLVWLAWDLGDELTDHFNPIWDYYERTPKLHANALFLALMPAIAADRQASTALHDSIERTIKNTPVASLRAEKWLTRHMAFGTTWSVGAQECDEIKVGGYCRVKGLFDGLRVVVEVSQGAVGFWDFGRTLKFTRERVVAMVANH